jgi:hypothetical protein
MFLALTTWSCLNLKYFAKFTVMKLTGHYHKFVDYIKHKRLRYID